MVRKRREERVKKGKETGPRSRGIHCLVVRELYQDKCQPTNVNKVKGKPRQRARRGNIIAVLFTLSSNRRHYFHQNKSNCLVTYKIATMKSIILYN